MERRSWTSMVIVAVLAATLVALGGLQYHWTNEIAGAERNRLRNALDLGVNRVRQEMSGSLLQIAGGLHIDPEGNFEDWENRADPPAVVRNVYLVFPDRTVKAADDGTLQDAALSGVLTRLRDQFKPGTSMQGGQLDPRREGPPDGPPGDFPPPPRRRDRPGPRGFQPGVWTFFSDAPALGRALRYGYVVIELDRAMFRDPFLKEILEKQFSDRPVAAAPMFTATIGSGKPGEVPGQPFDANVNLLMGPPLPNPRFALP